MAKKEQYVAVAKRCIGIRTLTAARAISRAFDNALRSTGLTGTQFSLLVSVAQGSVDSMTSLGAVLSIDRSTLSRNFKPLVENGLVLRKSGTKGRAVSLELTPEGHKKLEEALPIWESVQAHIEESLADDSIQDGRDFLKDLRKAAELV